MANLLSLPENVVIQNLLPFLGHNDILRLRRVSKGTKTLADTYLWTSKRGNQGKWELEINSSRNGKTLHDFLQLNLPPPSKLYIAVGNDDFRQPCSFFEDEHLEEFKKRYSKYVTHLKLDILFLPFTSAEEIGFYDCLINLGKLSASTILTVGGRDEFEKKTKNAEGNFLIRPKFENLKNLKLRSTDCLDSMWNFINGVSENLEKIEHPFLRQGVIPISFNIPPNSLAPVQEFIERRRLKKLVYNWRHFCQIMSKPIELLRLFAACRDNGVMIKNLQGCTLNCLLCSENGTIDRREVWDGGPGGMVYRTNYQKNLFVGSIIQSLIGLVDAAFLLDMPALEKIRIRHADAFRFRVPENCRLPQWHNLKKMVVDTDGLSQEQLNFFCGRLILPNLEELSLNYHDRFRTMSYMPVPRSSGLVNCFKNLKKLSLNFCPGDTVFFLGLWEGLILLEEINLDSCWKLSNQCFIGNGSTPAFLRLQKLRHLSIISEENPLPQLTDKVFRMVFRHMKLSSFRLWVANGTSITVEGVKELLWGQFAETIEKLDVKWEYPFGASEEERDEVLSRFRSSKML